MRTGLTKQEKTTDIWFDEKDPLIHIRTHNTDLKKRLAAYAGQYPDQGRQTGHVRHVHHKQRARFPCGVREAPVVDDAAVGRCAGQDQLGGGASAPRAPWRRSR